MAAREKREGYTWLSVHMSEGMKEIISRLSRREDRSVSGMARRLMAEALRARGEDWQEDVDGDGD